MPDIFLYTGEPNPSDIKLRDPTTIGGAITIPANLAATEAQDVAAFAATLVHTATLAASEAPDVAAFSVTLVHVANLAATETQDVAAFTATVASTEEAVTHTGGKGDNDGRRKKQHRAIFKPTGLVDRPARKDIEQRVSESLEIAAEVAAEQLARESAEEHGAAPATTAPQVSLSAVDLEIRDLLHKEMQAQDMRIILALLAAVV